MSTVQTNPLAKYFIIAVLALVSSPAFSQVSLSIDIAPPPLPVYAQPICPEDGYMWTPGYWAYGDDGYYWVPGAWVQPPQVGMFWTPCYWGWNGNAYAFNSGYWGQNVGFYGGINYGYGYGGNGYNGGRWQGRHFSYNTAVSNVNAAHFRHTYADRTAINNNTRNVSYNGGNGGVQAQATAQQRQFSQGRHIQPTSVQRAQVRAASQDRGQLATVNGGKPVTAAAASTATHSRVTQQHAVAQPLAQQRATLAKSSTAASFQQQTRAQSQSRLANAHQESLPTTTHNATVKSHANASPTYRVPSKPQPQFHAQPQARAQSQSRAQPQARAQPQSRAQPQARAQSQSHAQPQGRSDKSQAH